MTFNDIKNVIDKVDSVILDGKNITLIKTMLSPIDRHLVLDWEDGRLGYDAIFKRLDNLGHLKVDDSGYYLVDNHGNNRTIKLKN